MAFYQTKSAMKKYWGFTWGLQPVNPGLEDIKSNKINEVII